MEIKTFIKNYIKEYENHFKGKQRTDVTFERVEYAGWLLDKNFPEFTKDATYYKALYEKCLKSI